MMHSYWDIHTHILPGLDDGASCLEEAMDMLTEECEQGVQHVVLTPHFRTGMFYADEKERRDAFARIKELTKQMLPQMQVHLGCELHMHQEEIRSTVSEEPWEKDIFRMPGDGVILTEFSGRDDYNSIIGILEPILQSGYRCIIAHAERYRLTEADIRMLHEQEGIWIQMNTGIILGREGFMRKRFAGKLIAGGFVDLVGSDAHNTENRTVNIGKCIRYVSRKYGEEMADQIFQKNPETLFWG